MHLTIDDALRRKLKAKSEKLRLRIHVAFHLSSFRFPPHLTIDDYLIAGLVAALLLFGWTVLR